MSTVGCIQKGVVGAFERVSKLYVDGYIYVCSFCIAYSGVQVKENGLLIVDGNGEVMVV